MDANALDIEREVLRWPGVTSEPGRFGAAVFRYGKREIGHVHLPSRRRCANRPCPGVVRARTGPGAKAT